MKQEWRHLKMPEVIHMGKYNIERISQQIRIGWDGENNCGHDAIWI